MVVHRAVSEKLSAARLGRINELRHVKNAFACTAYHRRQDVLEPCAALEDLVICKQRVLNTAALLQTHDGHMLFASLLWLLRQGPFDVLLGRVGLAMNAR